ncbi:MAG: hypothetical protein KKA90_00965 [Nanoarchaeota archaeon]|nr:hypothetical protein [Nanoarchaeota archaeon]
MKPVFIAASRKFKDDTQAFIRLCTEHGIPTQTAGKILDEEDTFESERDALFRAFEWIDKASVVYVIAKGGYVGRTVAMELAYAYAMEKPVIASEELQELSARAVVNKVLAPEAFIAQLTK